MWGPPPLDDVEKQDWNADIKIDIITTTQNLPFKRVCKTCSGISKQQKKNHCCAALQMTFCRLVSGWRLRSSNSRYVYMHCSCSCFNRSSSTTRCFEKELTKRNKMINDMRAVLSWDCLLVRQKMDLRGEYLLCFESTQKQANKSELFIIESNRWLAIVNIV